MGGEGNTPSAKPSLRQRLGDLVCFWAPRELSPDLYRVHSALYLLLHLWGSPSSPGEPEGRRYLWIISLLSAISTGPDTCRGFNVCWLFVDLIQLPKEHRSIRYLPHVLHCACDVLTQLRLHITHSWTPARTDRPTGSRSLASQESGPRREKWH